MTRPNLPYEISQRIIGRTAGTIAGDMIGQTALIAWQARRTNPATSIHPMYVFTKVTDFVAQTGTHAVITHNPNQPVSNTSPDLRGVMQHLAHTNTLPPACQNADVLTIAEDIWLRSAETADFTTEPTSDPHTVDGLLIITYPLRTPTPSSVVPAGVAVLAYTWDQRGYPTLIEPLAPDTAFAIKSDDHQRLVATLRANT
jgi:hypothetical protein